MLRMHLYQVMVLAAALINLPAALRAQGCFPGRPLPDCRGFLVTEIGYTYRVTGAMYGTEPQRHYLNGEIGYLRNTSPRLAIGGSLFGGALVDYAFEFRPGLKARLRYWAAPGIALDLGAGPVLGRVASSPPLQGFGTRGQLGVTSHASLSAEDLFILVAMAEYLPSPADHDVSFYLGARLGSRVGIFAALLTGAFLGAACAVACGG